MKKSRRTYRDSRDIRKKRVQMTSRIHLNKDNIQKLIVSCGKPAFLVLDFSFKGDVCLHLTSTQKDSATDSPNCKVFLIVAQSGNLSY